VKTYRDVRCLGFHIIWISAVQRSYVLGHNSLMPMEVRAPPHYYYYYYYYHLIRTTPSTTNNNYVKIFNSTQIFMNVFVLKFELILIIGSNNVLTEGARKVYRGRRVGEGLSR
jgi:hypothetical protein